MQDGIPPFPDATEEDRWFRERWETQEAKRAIAIESAITTLTSLPDFARIDATMRELTGPIVREMETVGCPPRRQAIEWFDICAETYLPLIADHASWNSYKVRLYEIIHPQAYWLLFGSTHVQPVSADLRELERRLNERLGYWHQEASRALANRIDLARIDIKGAAQLTSKWEDVQIWFLDKARVKISVGTYSEECDYIKLGFQDTRTGNPNQQWAILTVLARFDRTLKDDARHGDEWIAIQKKVERTRKRLQKYFGLSDDPLPYTKNIGYRARFNIGGAADLMD